MLAFVGWIASLTLWGTKVCEKCSFWFYHVGWLMKTVHMICHSSHLRAPDNWASGLRRWWHVDRVFMRTIWRQWRRRDKKANPGDGKYWEALDESVAEALKRDEVSPAEMKRLCDRETGVDVVLDPIQDLWEIAWNVGRHLAHWFKARPFTRGYHGRMRQQLGKQVAQDQDEELEKMMRRLNGLPGIEVMKVDMGSGKPIAEQFPPHVRALIEKVEKEAEKRDPMNMETEEWERRGGPAAS